MNKISNIFSSGLNFVNKMGVDIGSSVHRIPIQVSVVFYVQLNLTINIPTNLQDFLSGWVYQAMTRHVQQKGREYIKRYLQDY